ncbi:MAG: hypothetical protein WC725_04530 [Patescibacteria group bacterium]|jgi:hypothetical protein
MALKPHHRKQRERILADVLLREAEAELPLGHKVHMFRPKPEFLMIQGDTLEEWRKAVHPYYAQLIADAVRELAAMRSAGIMLAS